MEKQEYHVGSWLRAATQGIRFDPDRRAVEEELRAHIQDKTDDLMRIFPGIGVDEAKSLALDQMGDPEELGAELARIHKPWWGWLWVASKWALGLSLALVVALAAWRGLQAEYWADQFEGYNVANPYFQDRDDWDGTYDVRARAEHIAYPEGVELKLGDCSLTLVRAAWCPDGEEEQTGLGWEETDGYLALTFQAEVPWAPAKDSLAVLGKHWTAADSMGHTYEDEYQVSQENKVTPDGRMVSSSRNAGSYGHGPFWTDLELYLRRVPKDVDWVELEYNWQGRTAKLTLEREVWEG